jgi:hypothetical protein
MNASAEWFDPLRDPRWTELLARHPRASVFQSPGWLEALQRTYQYEPVGIALTASSGAAFRGALVFCRVNSRLTGRRLVSLPFSDYSDPLVESDDDLMSLLGMLGPESPQWKYIELRPRPGLSGEGGFTVSDNYFLHRLDLTQGLQAAASGLHKNHVVRRIRRSEREKLVYCEGASELLPHFYGLVVKTRRRHSLPPQPLGWFRGILDSLPNESRLRVAFKDRVAVAGVMTLCYGPTMMYKYGAADPARFQLGGMQLLLWKTLQDACARGCATFDLGRSKTDSHGEIAFKDHWGAVRCALPYWRRPAQKPAGYVAQLAGKLGRGLFSRLPDRLLVAAGDSFYRHVG